MYGDGLFYSLKGNLLKGRLPCGCAKSHRKTEAQWQILCERAAKSIGHSWLGWSGTYKGCFTKCKITCSKHGMWETTTVASLVHTLAGCTKCANESFTRQPDEVSISKFRLSGSFHDGTTFTRTKRLDSYGYETFWQIVCGICKEEYESQYPNIIAGKVGCSCNRKNIKYAYLISIFLDGEYIANKIGVSSNPKRRKIAIQSSSLLDFLDMRVWKFDQQVKCIAAESALKKELDTGVINKILMLDGYTETINTFNDNLVADVYVKFGGIEITAEYFKK